MRTGRLLPATYRNMDFYANRRKEPGVLHTTPLQDLSERPLPIYELRRPSAIPLLAVGAGRILSPFSRQNCNFTPKSACTPSAGYIL